MKQETKELVAWIINVINVHPYSITSLDKSPLPDANIFLTKTLPEIESKLCQGGYIQDANGVPCCNGDKVKIKVKSDYAKQKFAGQYLEGFLTWNQTQGRFYVITRQKDFEFSELEYPYIEKVE